MACATCGSGSPQKKCGKCTGVAYCSKKCQLCDWPVHKWTCAPTVEVRPSPGCDMGLFAKNAHRMGAKIVCEKPLVVMRYQRLAARPCDAPFATVPLAAAAFSDASHMAKKVAFKLDDRFTPQAGKPPSPLGILTTCGISLGESTQAPPAGLRGLFALACRVNHSCSPNARYAWNEDTQKEVMIAIRPIQPDEEITVSYDEDLHNTERAVRRVDLHERFDFWCECKTCRASSQTEAAPSSHTSR